MGNSSSQEDSSKRQRRASSSQAQAPAQSRQQQTSNGDESAAAKALQQVQGSDKDRIPAVDKTFEQPEDTQQRAPQGSQPSQYTPSAADRQNHESVAAQPRPIRKSNNSSSAHDEFIEHVETADDDGDPPAPTAPGTSEHNVATAASAAASAAPARPGFPRRKSAIVLETEDEVDQLQRLDIEPTVAEEEYSRPNDGQEVVESEGPKFDVTIVWRQGGQKVYVTGSFASWRKMIRMGRQDDSTFTTVVKLPMGTHRLRFVVDNELRCSDFLETATDSMGNLMNYIVIDKDGHLVTADDEPVYEEYQDEDHVDEDPDYEYCREIPEVFTNSEAMDRFVSSDFVTPPQLPPHLEGVILNSNNTEKDNNSVLPIPNHVVLNHLATTSIRHNVLAVASISRYSGKYVTQVLYAPL